MRNTVSILVLALIMALAAAAQTDPLAVLQSEAPFVEKAEACRLLSISGDVNAIPVLEPLLVHAELADMARYALEPMPGTEANAALRRALTVTSGKGKAGVVSSLGVRRDVFAVPELIPLLNDADGFVKEAAARALGRIAAPEGISALETAIAQPGLAYAIAQSLGDGLFAAAEHARTNGRSDEAARLYDLVYAVEALPVHIRAGALRGAVLARKPLQGRPLLLEAIKSDNEDFFTAALRIAQEMKGKKKTSTELAAALPTISPERKVRVIQLLGELGKPAAGPALLQEAETGPVPVRVAALGAVVRLAYAPALPLLTSLVASEDADLARAARDGLSYFPGPEGDVALRDMLKSSDAQVRRIAVELIGQGALPAPAELLMQIAGEDAEDSVRVAALASVKEYAGKPQISGLLGHLLTPRSNEEMQAAEQGLIQTVMLEKEASSEAPAGLVDALCDALASSEGEKKLSVLRVLTSTGSQKAFDTVLPLASTGEGEVKEAAARAVCDWPAYLALPTLMEWVNTPPDATFRAHALRGAVRLLAPGQDTPEQLCPHYGTLLGLAASPDEKKLVLSGLATVAHPSALAMALDQLGDEAVKTEAVLAATAIAKTLDASPQNTEVLERAKSLIPELSAALEK